MASCTGCCRLVARSLCCNRRGVTSRTCCGGGTWSCRRRLPRTTSRATRSPTLNLTSERRTTRCRCRMSGLDTASGTLTPTSSTFVECKQSVDHYQVCSVWFDELGKWIAWMCIIVVNVLGVKGLWLEMAIVADHTMIKFHGKERVTHYILALMNIVSIPPLYRLLCLFSYDAPVWSACFNSFNIYVIHYRSVPSSTIPLWTRTWRSSSTNCFWLRRKIM